MKLKPSCKPIYALILLHLTGLVIPALMHRIPSELRSQAGLGESSTRMGDLLGVLVLHFFLYLFFVFCFSYWPRQSIHEFSELSRSGPFGNWQLDSLRHFEQLSFFTRLHPTSRSKVMAVRSFPPKILSNSKYLVVFQHVRTPPPNIP